MKRFMTLLLAMLMVLSLAACGDKASATVDAEGLGKALAERVQFDSTMSAIDAGDYLELPEGSSAAAYMSDGSTMEEIFVVSCKDKTDASAPLHHVAVFQLVTRAAVVGIPTIHVVHPAGQTTHVELIEVVDTLYIRAVVHGRPV